MKLSKLVFLLCVIHLTHLVHYAVAAGGAAAGHGEEESSGSSPTLPSEFSALLTTLDAEHEKLNRLRISYNDALESRDLSANVKRSFIVEYIQALEERIDVLKRVLHTVTYQLQSFSRDELNSLMALDLEREVLHIILLKVHANRPVPSEEQSWEPPLSEKSRGERCELLSSFRKARLDHEQLERARQDVVRAMAAQKKGKTPASSSNDE